MKHPIVQFLLDRYDEEDPDDPDLPALRDAVAQLECHMIVGGDLYPYPDVSKQEYALGGLKIAAFKYRDHPDFDEDWRLPFDTGQHPQGPTT